MVGSAQNAGHVHLGSENLVFLKIHLFKFIFLEKEPSEGQNEGMFLSKILFDCFSLPEQNHALSLNKDDCKVYLTIMSPWIWKKLRYILD